MKVAIHQPNFLPWAGYFYKLLRADVFVFFDTVQFPRGKSYCSRVKIKSPGGVRWLTVPVRGRGGLLPIKDVQVSGDGWVRKHLGTLTASYSRAPFFNAYYSAIESIYSKTGTGSRIADFNIRMIIKLAEELKAGTKFVRASDLDVAAGDTGTYIIDLVKALKGTIYLTGQGAGTIRHMDEQSFRETGIKVEMFDYADPPYPQCRGEDFMPGLSVVDVLFNTGEKARDLILSGGKVI